MRAYLEKLNKRILNHNLDKILLNIYKNHTKLCWGLFLLQEPIIFIVYKL